MSPLLNRTEQEGKERNEESGMRHVCSYLTASVCMCVCVCVLRACWRVVTGNAMLVLWGWGLGMQGKKGGRDMGYRRVRRRESSIERGFDIS